MTLRKSAAYGLLVLLLAGQAWPADDTCDKLMAESEALWVALDFAGSDKPLNEAEKICPKRAEIKWRYARNAYGRVEQIPRDQKPPKEELLKVYLGVETLADQCIALDEKDGNCWVYKAVAIGRKGSTQGTLQTLPLVKKLEAALLKGIELKPKYRSANGAANSMGDLFSMLGIMYRVLPEWTCSFPFKSIIGTCGDLDKSIELHRKAVAREPGRIEYHKELAVSLLCHGQRRETPEEIVQAKKILADLQSLPEIKATDKIDKDHAKMLIQDPALACGYSRDAQQEQDKEAFQNK